MEKGSKCREEAALKMMSGITETEAVKVLTFV